MRKYKCVRQHDITDCAAACIATICLHYKKETTITKLRDMTGTDILGATALGIVGTLTKLGFEAKSWRGNKETLEEKFTLPAIVRMFTKEGLTHFMVLHKVTKKYMIVADPAKGIRKIEKNEFFEDFSGDIILCAPTSEFITEKIKTGSVFNRFFKLLLAQKSLFVYAIIGSIILTILGIASSFFNKILMDEIIPYNLENQLLVFCIGFGIIGLFNVVLGAARQHLLLHLSLKIDIPLMLGYFKHIFSLPMKFFGTRRTGDVLTRFQDAGTIKDIFTTISLSLIIDILLALITGVILYIMNPILFIVIAVITLINVVLVFIFKKPYKELNIQNMEKSSMLNSQIIDSLKGVETVKSFGVEEETLFKMEKKYMQSIKVGYRTSVLSNVQGSISGVISTISNIVLMYIGAKFVMNGDITLGSLFAFMSLSGYFMDPIGRLVGLQMQIQEASIAMKRMSELYDLEPEQDETVVLEDVDLNGDIEINDLTFRYGARQPILKDISLKINNKNKVAIVGTSGGGKTTLAKLILGLWEYEEGNIFINNNNINDINKTYLRNKIAYVPQNVELFTGSVLENIKLGKIDATISDVKKACKLAGCSEFIEKMPLNYNSFLEEAGANLSGGERQRIALARALLKNPEILILDEATSSLDFVSEQEIYNNLFNLDSTVIIIAHRLSTIRRCDEIIVIDKHRIAEIGTHETLLKDDGVYSNIWNSQTGELPKLKKVVETKNNDVKNEKEIDLDDVITYE